MQNFIQDYTSTSSDLVFAGTEKEKFLNQVICEHMYRHGFLEIGEELAKVCSIGTFLKIVYWHCTSSVSIQGGWAGDRGK